MFKTKYTFSNKYEILFPECKDTVDGPYFISSVKLMVKDVVMYEYSFTKPVIVQKSMSPIFKAGELNIETDKHDADIFLQIKDRLSVHLFDNQGREIIYTGYKPHFGPIDFQLK